MNEFICYPGRFIWLSCCSITGFHRDLNPQPYARQCSEVPLHHRSVQDKGVKKWDSCKNVLQNPPSLLPGVEKLRVQDKGIEKWASCKNFLENPPFLSPSWVENLMSGQGDKKWASYKEFLENPPFLISFFLPFLIVLIMLLLKIPLPSLYQLQPVFSVALSLDFLFFLYISPLATISKIPLSNSIFMLTILNSLFLALNLQSILLLYLPL